MPEIKMPPVPIKAEFKLCKDCNGYGYTMVERIVSDPIKKMLQMTCLTCHGSGKIKNYFTKKVKEKILSNQLHKYTKLTPDQLKRLEQQGGNGAHAKFTADGKLSLELVRRVELAKRRQPRFVLYSNEHGRNLYIADRDKVKVDKEETPVTTNVEEALTFIEGFDSEETKINYFGPLTKLKLMTKRV